MDSQGRLRRKLAGSKGNARDLYRKRKADALTGQKLPEKLRQRPATFAEIGRHETHRHKTESVYRRYAIVSEADLSAAVSRPEQTQLTPELTPAHQARQGEQAKVN